MKGIDIFPWNDHFNTGFETIDKQHVKLVELLNRLASHVANSSNEDDLENIFDELSSYTMYHFQTEEAIWHKYLPNDPLDSDHQAIHQGFIDVVVKLKNDQKTRPLIELTEEALGFLARWLASHILETDRYMAYLIFALEDGLELDKAKLQAKEKMSGSTRFLIDIILSIYSTLSSNTLHLMHELKHHQKFEEQATDQELYRDLLLELSTDFINLPLDEISKKISESLEKMANFVSADHAYIFGYDFDAKTTTNDYEWCKEGVKPQIQELQNISLSVIPQWPEIHSRGQYILIQDVSTLKKDSVYDFLSSLNIKSLVTFPLFEKNKCIGFVGFDAVKKIHTFSDNEIKILELFSTLLSNVSERKDNESLLSQEKNFLKTLFKMIPDLVWTKDVDGTYVSCNSRFEDFFGAKELEIVGKTDYDFVDKPLAELFRLNDKKVMKSGQANINEEKISFANDGHEEILQTTKVPMHDEEGKLIGVMGVGRDITSIKKIQEDLQVEKNRFILAVDGSRDGIWEWNLETNVLFFRERFELMLGYKQGTLKHDASTWFDLLHPDDKEHASKTVYEYLGAKGDGLYECTFRLKAQDGSWRWILGRAKGEFDKDGKALKLVGFNTDITEKKVLEQEIEKSYETLNKLADNLPGAIYQYRLFPDGSNTFPYISKGAEDIFELSVEAMREDATLIFKYIYEDDISVVNASIRESIKTLNILNIEFRVNLPKKGLCWIHGKSKPELLEDGSVLWYGVFNDVTAAKALEMKYAQQAKIIDQIHDAVITTDLQGRILNWNNGAEALLGYSLSEVIGHHVTMLYLEEDYTVLGVTVALLMRDGECNVVRKLVKKSKEVVDVDLSLSLLKDENGESIGMIGYAQDITKRKKIEDELVTQHKYLQTIIDGVDDPIMVIREDYTIELMNDSLKTSLASVKMADPEHPKCYEVSHHRSTPCDGLEHPCPLRDVLETRKHTTVVHKHDTKDGKGRSIELSASPLFDSSSNCIGIIESARDITSHLNVEVELREQKNILDHQAHHDALTGLPNRVLFNDRLEQAIETAKRKKTNFALMFLDLDHFKEINDSLGHDMGDKILKNVCKRLDEVVREEDTVARLGGDEFTVILEGLSQVQDASVVANKILNSLSEAFIIGTNILYVSCSIGISVYPNDGESAQDLLKYADSAMYKAKDEGRNNYQYYNSTMTKNAFERVVMEASLRAALSNEEFVVYYQPQINGVTDEIVGMEALVRWEHPNMGLVLPSYFLPLAESTGLIVELDRYVMKTAMEQFAYWYKQGYNPGTLAMNLTVSQLKKDDFMEMLQELIKETKCKPEWIELELTEGQIMTNPDEAIKILQNISDIGIELAVDDFGTGYSSLAYLKRLPINKLKIDQAFVRDLPEDEEDAAITKAVIALAKSLNLKVIAEGVETQDQKNFIVENGCENIQGYFYSKPVSSKEIEALLVSQ